MLIMYRSYLLEPALPATFPKSGLSQEELRNKMEVPAGLRRARRCAGGRRWCDVVAVLRYHQSNDGDL